MAILGLPTDLTRVESVSEAWGDLGDALRGSTPELVVFHPGRLTGNRRPSILPRSRLGARADRRPRVAGPEPPGRSGRGSGGDPRDPSRPPACGGPSSATPASA